MNQDDQFKISLIFNRKRKFDNRFNFLSLIVFNFFFDFWLIKRSVFLNLKNWWILLFNFNWILRIVEKSLFYFLKFVYFIIIFSYFSKLWDSFFFVETQFELTSIIISFFLSFSLPHAPEKFCRNPYNVTGICSRNSCPLANGRYATVRDHKGILYLFIKTVEVSFVCQKLIDVFNNFIFFSFLFQ